MSATGVAHWRQQIELASLRWRYPVWPLCVAAIVLLSLVAVWPLLSGKLPLTGDIAQTLRIYEMQRCLSDGQVPCRWVPDLGNGYGYPLFNYYPPLPYYAGAALHWLGFSYLMSADLLGALGLVGAGLSMFALARRFWGDLGGLVSAIAYLYAPYLALDVYMRGAVAETWALAVLPALFLALYELIESRKPRYLPVAALLGAVLLLSHNLVAVIAAPALLLWSGAFVARQGRAAGRSVLLLGVATIWAIGLAAFFTLPVLFEGDLVQLDTLSRYPFHYSQHFASVSDLFFLRSSDYSALLGVRRDTPVQIGWFHWGLALLALPLAVVAYRSGRRTAALVIGLFGLSFAIGVVMSVSASRFVWDRFDSLRFIQFPWRYLGLVSFAAAGLAGAAVAMLPGRSHWRLLLAGALIALFIVSGRTFFRPYYTCDLDDSDLLTDAVSQTRARDPVCDKIGPAWDAAIRDYVPSNVQEVPDRASAPASFPAGNAQLIGWRKGSDWLHLDIDAQAAARVEASVFDFPNWRVRVDGRVMPHKASQPHGLIAFDVPAGQHGVDLRLEDTGVRRLGNVLSLLSWAALVLGVPAIALVRRWKGQWAADSTDGTDDPC